MTKFNFEYCMKVQCNECKIQRHCDKKSRKMYKEKLTYRPFERMLKEYEHSAKHK